MNGLPDSGPGSLAYHAYFNEGTANDGNHALLHFPNSEERFRSLFRHSAARNCAAVTDPSGAPARGLFDAGI